MSKKHGKAVIVTIIFNQLGKGEKEARNSFSFFLGIMAGKQSIKTA
ncbi:hypothetical protein QFZ73_005410 [Peribacillus sp. V2I11]|nr:hypothetical protein [Peribacillus sp. V2I11]